MVDDLDDVTELKIDRRSPPRVVAAGRKDPRLDTGMRLTVKRRGFHLIGYAELCSVQ